MIESRRVVVTWTCSASSKAVSKEQQQLHMDSSFRLILPSFSKRLSGQPQRCLSAASCEKSQAMKTAAEHRKLAGAIFFNAEIEHEKQESRLAKLPADTKNMNEDQDAEPLQQEIGTAMARVDKGKLKLSTLEGETSDTNKQYQTAKRTLENINESRLAHERFKSKIVRSIEKNIMMS